MNRAIKTDQIFTDMIKCDPKLLEENFEIPEELKAYTKKHLKEQKKLLKR